jgi:ABC-type transporter Mla subunit MlaD
MIIDEKEVLNLANSSKLKKLLKEANGIKENVAKERDRLREITDDLEDIVGSMDDFITTFEDANDTLSQYL